MILKTCISQEHVVYITNFEIQTFSIAADTDQWMINSEILITRNNK